LAVTSNYTDAIPQVVVQKVRSKLEIKAISGEARHAKKQYYRNNRYQNVSDDQPIAQAPKQMIADPRHQPNDKINHGNETEKKEKPREGEPHIYKGEEAKNDIENKYA
jgi:hypothetical protein